MDFRWRLVVLPRQSGVGLWEAQVVCALQRALLNSCLLIRFDLLSSVALTIDVRRYVLHHQGILLPVIEIDNQYLAPPKYVPVVGWFTGWLNLLGQAATTASTDFACGMVRVRGVS
jgi:hypothetical protein